MCNYKKTVIIFSLLVFFVSFAGLNAGVLGNRKIETESQKDIAEMEKMIIRLFEQSYKTEDYDAIKKAILDEVKINFPITPGSEIVKINFDQIEKECDDKAKKKFPLNDEQLKQKFEHEAEIKFRPVELKEEIEVQYKMGADKVVRADFVSRIKKLETNYNLTLPKGASKKVLATAVNIIKTKGRENLNSVAKLHFKTYEQALETANK